MKKSFKTSLLMLLVITILLAFILPKHSIVGRWKMYNKDGSFVYVIFYQNGNVKETSADGVKVLHEGMYKFKDDVLSYTDTDNDGCGKGYWAKYKLTFVTPDSSKISVIEDSCTARKIDITSRKGLRRSNAK